MALDTKKREFYEMTLQTTREEIEDLNRSIENELASVRDSVNDLREEQKFVLHIYQNACTLMGVESELDDDEEDEFSDGEEADDEG